MTVRPFDWRDLGLLHRFRGQGVSLDARYALTRGDTTWQNIILDMVTPGLFGCTLVVRPEGNHGKSLIGQFSHRSGEPHAHIGFIGPEDAFADASALKLLDALGRHAGERQAQSLTADINEQCLVFEKLRNAGFAIYARQRIWKLSQSNEFQFDPTLAAWRRETSADGPAIRQLYANIVPALVQQVEAHPGYKSRNQVHWNQGELHGFLDIDIGARGVWIQAYFHPAAENLDELLAGFLAGYKDNHNRPLYFVVRSYQGWIDSALERLGFESHGDQAVMVKRLALPIRNQARLPLQVVDGTFPEPTAPFSSWDTPPHPSTPIHQSSRNGR
jgi:hypothetical protein